MTERIKYEKFNTGIRRYNVLTVKGSLAISPLDKAEQRTITGSVSMVPSLTDLAYSPKAIPAVEKRKTEREVIIATKTIFVKPENSNNDSPPVIGGYTWEHIIKPDSKDTTEVNPIIDAARIFPRMIVV